MKPEYQSLLQAGIEKKYRMLEEEIEKDIVRSIRKAGKITSAADWQIQWYLVLGHRTEDVEAIIRQAVGGDQEDVSRLYAEVIEQEYVRSKDVYEQVNAHFVPYEQNYELQQLVDVCGLGSGPGLLGWNCRHDFYPFIEGISVRNYSDEWLAEMDRKEAQKIPYRGKEYNTYEATQKQRQMETAMRAQREKVQLLKQGGGDKDDILNARCKYQAMLDEYKEFSRKFKLPEQRERIYYDLRGRVAPSQRTYKQWQADQAESVAIKKELRELGVRGKINIKPKKVDLNMVSFDDTHINKERGHNVTLEEAKDFIENAAFSETVWNGRFERYYSEKGTVYLNVNNLQIRTAFKPEEYGPKAQKIMEVIKEHGK